jgi:hypothetical protein
LERLCRLRPSLLACRALVGQAFSPDLSNHDSHVTVATRSWRAMGGVPERPGLSHVAVVALHTALRSSAPTASTVLESSGARPFLPLLHRLVALLAARPLMSSAPAASTVSESSSARSYPSSPEASMQWVECPRGWAGRMWFSWLSTPLLMSSAPVVLTIPESSGARSFPVLARQADGVANCSDIDVKCVCHANCPGELRGTTVPVLTRKASGVASRLATVVGAVPARRRL